MLVSAKDELTLVCQGAYIKLSGGNIELGAPNDIILKSNNLNKMGPASLASAFKQFDTTSFEQKYVIVSDLTKKPIANQKYKVEFSDGRTLAGITAENGETDLLTSQMLEVITIHLLNN